MATFPCTVAERNGGRIRLDVPTRTLSGGSERGAWIQRSAVRSHEQPSVPLPPGPQEGLGTSSGLRAPGVLARIIVLVVSTATTLVFAALFFLSLEHGYRFGIGTDSDGFFLLILGLAVVSVCISVYLIAVASQGLVDRLVRRWERSGSERSPHAPFAFSQGGAVSSVYPVLVGVMSVLFFAEATSLTLSLAASASTGQLLTVATNAFGEFWLELPLVVAALVLSSYLLCSTSLLASWSAYGDWRATYSASVRALHRTPHLSYSRIRQ